MTSHRRGLVIAVVVSLWLGLEGSASAGLLIKYRGETTQGKRIVITVLKRDSGRRFLNSFHIELSGMCEGGSTKEFGLFLLQTRPASRLGPDGEFELGKPLARGRVHALRWYGQGQIRFAAGDGAFEVAFKDRVDGIDQDCSSGPIEWDVERRRVRQVRAVGRSGQEART